jgi:hypothetical protein
MPLVGFESTISVGERPNTYALDRAATGIGNSEAWVENFKGILNKTVSETFEW